MLENKHLIPWAVLVSYFLILMIIDFFILNKKDKIISNKQAITETLFFITNALLFSGIIYYFYQHNYLNSSSIKSSSDALFKYLTGYIVELSLSVDNLFVMAVIFKTYKIPLKYQHKLLFLGILGAIFFRITLISVGLFLVQKVEGINIIFGLFLLFTAFKMLKEEDNHGVEADGEMKQNNKKLYKFLRISDKLDGGNFTTIINSKKVFTALFGALITIELTDILFALDSIPAILAITNEPYIIISSNIFAIMGLRSLYFFLANMLEKFKYLKYSVFVILVYVSIKLMVANIYHLPEVLSLFFIALSLIVGVLYSLFKINKELTK